MPVPYTKPEGDTNLDPSSVQRERSPRPSAKSLRESTTVRILARCILRKKICMASDNHRAAPQRGAAKEESPTMQRRAQTPDRAVPKGGDMPFSK